MHSGKEWQVRTVELRGKDNLLINLNMPTWTPENSLPRSQVPRLRSPTGLHSLMLRG